VIDGRDLEAVLRRAGGRRGAGRLRAVLEDWTEPPFTRREAERLLAEIIEGAGLPKPSFNCWVAGYEVDVHWPDHGLVVEFDSWEFHRTRRAFEQDRVRDADLGDVGLRVIRLTWRQLQDPEAAVARLSRALLQPRRTAS
jgi:very-short-patch-repair endonuclease